MSYAFSVSRRGLRTAAALGAATLGLLVTTACEKPTPLMTVTVGSETVTTEAACYAEDGKALSRDEGFACLKQKPDATIGVRQGDRVHVGVEPEMADAGWVVFANQRPMSAEELTSTYQTFDAEQWFQPQPGQGSAPDEVTLSVATLGEDELEGVWNIKVTREK
ncbi:DUF2771 domain-containing protein [Streptomyces sp. RKND-216]|uniref:DUF2771 domain-containing protein n=1 Tax=Streptomyces hazeniae TaxID=3075538 RepID=A0ABU2NNZ1_9ACTN|nr:MULTISPECIES: hypothetical protein [unclassified Streptomyces]MDT0378469.1 DUF2771 domain-containing protein [Streptomyces sp. DSM 42041]THA25838.1 DUF2771 domain-containing protein [Streptomyces sp. RKND-216]